MRLARDFAWSIRPRVPPAQRYNVQGNYHRMRESHASLTGDITSYVLWTNREMSTPVFVQFQHLSMLIYHLVNGYSVRFYVGVITNVLRALQPPRSLKASKSN